MSDPSAPPLTVNDLSAWIIARMFVLELFATGMMRLYLSSLRNVPTAEETTMRLEAFRESGLAGAALMPEHIRREATAYLNGLLDRAAKDIELGRAATLNATAAASLRSN
jgi:hypothetical protein